MEKTINIPVSWFTRLLEIREKIETSIPVEYSSDLSYLLGYIDSARELIPPNTDT